MRPLAILLATAHVVGSAVAAWLLFFIATFPFENADPDDGAWEMAFIAVGAVLLGLGVATCVGVVRRKLWTFGSLGLHLLVGLAFLLWAVGSPPTATRSCWPSARPSSSRVSSPCP